MITEIGNFLLSIATALSFCMFFVIFTGKIINVGSRLLFCKLFIHLITFLINLLSLDLPLTPLGLLIKYFFFTFIDAIFSIILII